MTEADDMAADIIKALSGNQVGPGKYELKRARSLAAQGNQRKGLPAKTTGKLGNRERTYCEQSAQCHYCGTFIVFAQWTIDHKTPLCRGGRNEAGNIVGACNTCNKNKGPLTYEEFLATEYMGGLLDLKEERKRVNVILASQKSA